MTLHAPTPPKVRTVPDARPAACGRKLVLRIALGLLGMVLLGAVLGWLLRAPITLAGTWFMSVFGLTGLGTMTLLVDASPVPLTHEPLMVLALGAGVDPWTIFGVMSAGSVLAGSAGWVGGRVFGVRTRIGRWLVGRYPGVQIFMRRWGAVGVAIAALSPIPFGLTAWTAGMTGVPGSKVFLASFARVPKTGFYLWLIAQGWALAG